MKQNPLHMNRRHMIGTMTGAFAAVSYGFVVKGETPNSFGVSNPMLKFGALDTAPSLSTESFELPEFNYSKNGLCGILSPFTIRAHHAVVHRRIVDRLNRASNELLRQQNDARPELAADWAREYSRLLREHQSLSVYWRIFSHSTGRNAESRIPWLRQAVSTSFGSAEQLALRCVRLAESRTSGNWIWIFYFPGTGRFALTKGNSAGDGWISGANLVAAIDVADRAYASTPNLRKSEFVRRAILRMNWKEIDSLAFANPV